MIKKPDIKGRKKLRLVICVLYLIQITICTLPFFESTNLDFKLPWLSPFYLVIFMFQSFSGTIALASILCLLLILVPVIGFFACALDKERNIKNIISIFCCLAGVFLITAMLGGNNVKYISYGAIFAILMYFLIMMLTSVAMVMRLSKDVEEPAEPKKKRRGFKFQEFEDEPEDE